MNHATCQDSETAVQFNFRTYLDENELLRRDSPEGQVRYNLHKANVRMNPQKRSPDEGGTYGESDREVHDGFRPPPANIGEIG
jgi:hypothetical protein